MSLIRILLLMVLLNEVARAADRPVSFSGERKRNNLVTELLEVPSIRAPGGLSTFTRSTDGWVWISATTKGNGTVRIILDPDSTANPLIVHDREGAAEAMRHLRRGVHTLRVECQPNVQVENLSARAIPELIHCGLGFNPEIKSYGSYDLDFLRADILPNVTTLIVPHNIQLPEAVIDDWHRQGKRWIAEVGVSSPAQTVADHFQHWRGYLDRRPFLDGLIINEFIVNKPWTPAELTPERQKRMEGERQQYQLYAEALKRFQTDERYRPKLIYAYVGGSGKKLNQEVIGTNLVRTIKEGGYRIALERYLHEMSSESGSRAALDALIEGVADWEAKEPGITKQMVIVFGLFSMPPGSINKQPDVDYHVWMDQQMNLVANHPQFAGVGGLEWWTTTLADEETVRFAGKLFRHYALEGRTGMFTKDPLLLSHLQNPDFEKGAAGWTLQPAEAGSIAARSFPRFGRIEGRYMGLGRPPDPEHIGDTFLWMKRSARGPNTFSQAIKGLEPGRLYSLKMFSCDYQDLVNPTARKLEKAARFTGSVTLEQVEVDPKRSFVEMYSSSPEPKIPVWITYHWTVFRAKDTTARLTVSDWPKEPEPGILFGQEQVFNFLELQPYHGAAEAP